MNQNDMPIKYIVRYTSPNIRGFCALPIWIPFNADPMTYARKTLDEICPNGYDIEDLRIPIKETLSDEQLELNDKYLNRIFEILK